MSDSIDDDGGELAGLQAEFDSRPFGRHSPQLHALLAAFRSAPVPGKHVLYMTESHRSWSLARISPDEPRRLEVAAGRHYSSILDAERDVFALRLDAHRGRPVDAVDFDTVPDTPPVLGYAGQDSVHAGERIHFCVSNESARPYRADVVRLRTPDVGPAGEPFQVDATDTPITGNHDTSRQELRPGSYVVIDDPVTVPAVFTLSAYVRPTLLRAGRQTFISLVSDTSGAWTLSVCCDGRLDWQWVDSTGTRSCTVASAPIAERQWSFVWAWADRETGRLGVGTRSVHRSAWSAEPGILRETDGAPAVGRRTNSRARVGFGARVEGSGTNACSFFNGQLERPRLFARALTLGDAAALSAQRPDAPAAGLVSDWDFAADIMSERVADVVGGHHGHTVNLPTRAIRGSAWSGRSLDWRTEPSAYAAIHFHEDDIADAAWEPTFELEVPAEWPSGCYALRLVAAAGDEFYVPFFVRPPRGTVTCDVAFLVPTATYAAYANMRLRLLGQAVEMQHGRLTVVDATDLLALDHPGLGASTYDTHADGSLVTYSSLRRPVTNFRPTGRIYKFCQDLLITSWLDHEQVPFDVLTDEDLHREGIDAISRYRVLVTASHPEYVSEPMLDTIETYLRDGGRLMYLGGNGYYTAAEFHPSIPGTVEVRRPGLEALWPIDHTEGHFSFTGRPAGALAKIGRRAEPLVGVAFITQGFDACSYYRRTPASTDPRVAFVFDGVHEDVIGDFGLLQGGAAGYEIDRFDLDRGSPPHALVLASSEGHSNVYDLMVASIVDKLPGTDPDAPDSIRADLVFFETGAGGAVFSVGSIAWSGSLAEAGFDNNVAAITRNVVTRFRSPEKFPAPPQLETT